MPQRPGLLDRTKRFPPPLLVLSIALAGLILGISVWSIYAGIFHNASSSTPNMQRGTSTHPATNGTQSSGAVPPLIFGTNLGLFNSQDQVLTSATTRTLLQQIHIQIIRMPVRSTLSEAIEIQAAQIIKSLGATPLVILRGAVDQNVVSDDTHIINDMNHIFGKNTVYYEYGNEEDLLGVPVTTYTASWNAVIPQLRRLALNGQFVGPVTYHYDSNYLASFLQNAQPRPDQVSWHEYTCDDSWAANICIAHIANWTTHITHARATMRATIGIAIPIMITEWNYAPNAVPDDGKNNNSAFMTTWTTLALQTLAANRIFASMQYSATNTLIPLISSGDTMTTQGTVFQAQYQQMIALGQQPTSVPTTSMTQPASPASSTVTGNDKLAFSFEDGSTDGWSGHGQGIVNVQNSTTVALDGKQALQVTVSNISRRDFPYISVSTSTLSSYPQAGQTITAYIYLPANAASLMAKVFVMASNYQWYSGPMLPLTPGTWNHLTYTLPSAINGPLRQIGIQFNATADSGISSDVYIDAISW
jgi:mannanase-like protein